jgi:uncharacterized protein DUF5999
MASGRAYRPGIDVAWPPTSTHHPQSPVSEGLVRPFAGDQAGPIIPDSRRVQSRTLCQHQPCCPPADQPDREAARTVASHPVQGWSLLCNGVVVFDDTGELLPSGESIPPHRPTDVGTATGGPGRRRVSVQFITGRTTP